jgi:N-acylglucosamine 2-epimerase
LLLYFRGDAQLKQVAIERFIDRPYSYGLDPLHGGLFYFLDIGGYPPTQLEWGMKLWWVHCEAMLAFLKAYQATRSTKYWTLFNQMMHICFTKVSTVNKNYDRHTPKNLHFHQEDNGLGFDRI